MMADVMRLAWAQKVGELLGADPEFRKDARALSGTICLFDEGGGVSLRFDRGALLGIADAPDPRGSHYRLGGTREAWQRALAGGADVNKVTAVGGLSLEGDVVGVAGNAKAFARLWDALKHAAED